MSLLLVRGRPRASVAALRRHPSARMGSSATQLARAFAGGSAHNRGRLAGAFGPLPIDSGRRLTAASGGNVIEYLARRLVYIVPLLFLVTLVTFSVALLLPGDPALAYIGEANMRDRVMYETMRRELGLDQPIPMQTRSGWAGCCEATSVDPSGRASR